MSGKHTSLRVILTAILLFALALIAFLEGSKAVAISWTIIGIGTCYALWHVVKQSRIWWLGRNSRVAQRERFLKLLISLMLFCNGNRPVSVLFSMRSRTCKRRAFHLCQCRIFASFDDLFARPFHVRYRLQPAGQHRGTCLSERINIHTGGIFFRLHGGFAHRAGICPCDSLHKTASNDCRQLPA